MQREKEAWTLEEYEATLGQRPQYASGGQIENFRQGWALNIMGGDRAHYFRRSGFEGAIALCGARSDVRWIYGPGNYLRCKTCDRMARRFR